MLARGYSSLLFKVMRIHLHAAARTPLQLCRPGWGGAMFCSETELLELCGELLNRLVSHCASAGGDFLCLEFVELGRLDLSLLLEAVDEVVLGPAGGRADVSEAAESAVGLQALNAESFGDNLTLLVIEGERNTVEDLQVAHGGGTASGLVRDHSTDDLPEISGGGEPVLVTSARVRVSSLVDSFFPRQFVSEQRA